jgi:hypothetical protein
MEKKNARSAHPIQYTEPWQQPGNVLSMTSAEITLGITTHQGNKEAHLRAIVKPRHYRSSATVTTELLAKVDKAKVLTDIYERKLAVIGRLENKMADEDKQMDLNVARPSEKTPQKILKINQSKGDGSEGDLQTHYIALMFF